MFDLTSFRRRRDFSPADLGRDLFSSPQIDELSFSYG